MTQDRMGESPYAFYRAGAKLMATDLATTPTTNLIVQASGDAHLANFGWYGSPERQLVFDANDFDETLRASFEWDVKRLVASFVIAGRDSGFDSGEREEIARFCAEQYRDAMRSYASSGVLEVWYAYRSAQDVLAVLIEEQADEASRQPVEALRQLIHPTPLLPRGDACVEEEGRDFGLGDLGGDPLHVALHLVERPFVSGEIAKSSPDAMTVSTPVATIGIRGTQVGISYREGQQMELVLMSEANGFTGEVIVSNAAGVQVLSQPNQITSVQSANTPPTPPHDWSFRTPSSSAARS